MSGYDGEGTGVDFGGSGSEVADSAAPGQSAPNASLSLAEQLGEYGRGRAAAEVAAGYGLGGSDYGLNPGQVNVVAAPSIAEYFTAGLQFLGGLFGVASPSPMGKVGGAQALSASGAKLGGLLSDPYAGRHHDLGFAGNLGERASSGAASVFEGGGEIADRAAIGSPVLDYLGQPMRLVDRPGFQPGPGRALAVATAARAPGATTPAAAGQSPLGALILAGAAAFALGS